MITQLNPPIPMDTPKGAGFANFLIDYGMEHDLYWVVFINESKECWTLSNRDIRVQQNLSIGRGKFHSYGNIPHKDNKKIALNQHVLENVGQPFGQKKEIS